MPTEIAYVETFVELSEGVESCIIKRLGDVVKLKLRTPRRLYTLKVEKERAEEVIKRLKCKTVEV